MLSLRHMVTRLDISRTLTNITGNRLVLFVLTIPTEELRIHDISPAVELATRLVLGGADGVNKILSVGKAEAQNRSFAGLVEAGFK